MKDRRTLVGEHHVVPCDAEDVLSVDEVHRTVGNTSKSAKFENYKSRA